jgi:hypothetical protein
MGKRDWTHRIQQSERTPEIHSWILEPQIVMDAVIEHLKAAGDDLPEDAEYHLYAHTEPDMSRERGPYYCLVAERKVDN